MIVVATLAVKLAAYTAWCAFGLKLLRGERPSAGMAALYAVLRLVLGLVLGSTVMLLVSKLAPAQNRLGLSIPMLIVWLTLLRWVEWGVVGGLMSRRLDLAMVLGPAATRPLLWKAGGLALSYATDAAALATVGVLGWMPC